MGKIVEFKPASSPPDPPGRTPHRLVFVIVNVLLILGCVLIVGASWLTWRSLEDDTVFRILIPGVLGGLVCIIIAVTLRPETKNREDEGDLS